jgi:hypothetical protein
MPASLADSLAAHLLQLKPVSAPVHREKDQKQKQLEFHAWSTHQLQSYEESEQRHFFLLEKSGFYHSLQAFLEKSQAGWIIYRPVSRGGDVVWIRTLEPVQKGAAVIIGDCAVGFVDIASGLCARVRLVTDVHSRVSVEVRKQEAKESQMVAYASRFRLASDVAYWKLLAEHGLFQGLPNHLNLIELLNLLEKELTLQGETQKKSDQVQGLQGLLKGGTGTWRSQKRGLIAEGFYQEVELAPKTQTQKTPSIEIGDLLVTSGLDGRYPPGLRVGYVTAVQAKDAADTLFEVEASVALADFSKEKWVWVLPAITPLEELNLNKSAL